MRYPGRQRSGTTEPPRSFSFSFSDEPGGRASGRPGPSLVARGLGAVWTTLALSRSHSLRSVPDAVASTGPPPEPSPTNAHPYTSSGCPPRTSTRAIAPASGSCADAPPAPGCATRHRHAVPSADPVARIVIVGCHATRTTSSRWPRHAPCDATPARAPIARASRRATRERSRPPRRWRTASRPRDKTRRRTRGRSARAGARPREAPRERTRGGRRPSARGGRECRTRRATPSEGATRAGISSEKR